MGKVATRLLAAVGLGLGLLRLVYLRRVGVRISEGGLVRVRVRATVTTIRKVSVKASRTNFVACLLLAVRPERCGGRVPSWPL